MPETLYHNFADSLRRSHEAEDLPFWGEAYRKLFPGFASMTSHRNDGPHQRAGIDRSVLLWDSTQVKIDEKVRWRNKLTGKVYEDIALEFLSDEERRVPGWVCKPLQAHYIAYAIAPLGRCYLLPVHQLQEAWRRYESEWKASYPPVRARNRDGQRFWTTLSVGVPPGVIYQAITRTLFANFAPCDHQPRNGSGQQQSEEELTQEWYDRHEDY